MWKPPNESFFINVALDFISVGQRWFTRYFIDSRGAKAPKKKKWYVSNRKVICLEIEIDPF